MEKHMPGNKNEHSINERLELSMLYDFYGALLKENQRRIFEASVLEDFNFSEIAQYEGITRQGAYDTVKRAIKQLRGYEEKLGLIAKFEEQKNWLKNCVISYLWRIFHMQMAGWMKYTGFWRRYLKSRILLAFCIRWYPPLL